MKHSILEKLGFKVDSGASKASPKSAIARDIAAGLSHLDADRIRYLAAFGGLMGIVANADQDISAEEDARILAILKAFTELEEGEAEAVRRIIREQTRALDGLENHIYTRTLNELATHKRKLEILSCLFAVAAADDDVSGEEDSSIQIIAKGLRLTHDDYLRVRSLYRDKLSVLKDLPGRKHS